ncbi:phospholipid scramblase 1-like [Diadema setosum]|uniref:phospholipid scramblase 1-like n=1 Tax=Diadema setosum TaxID=31175 RepID=UPI003B3A3FAF
MGDRLEIVTSQPRRDVESVELRNWASRSHEDSASFYNRKLQRALRDLAGVDEINVKQKAETVGSSCTGVNEYYIVTPDGNVLYNAVEETTCCSRCWCGPARSFRMSVRNAANEEVLLIVRPHRCDACCCPCCLMSAMVQSPGGYVLGYTRQKWSFCGATFSISGREDRQLATMESECCPCRCCTSMDITILSRVGQEGAITKRWGGRKHYVNMDHEFFTLQFPAGSDLRTKAVLMGAAFLADYMFFEMT